MSDANSMLKSLGVGINLDMTQVVEKQIRQMLAALKTEIQSTAKQTGEITTKMVTGLTSSAKEMEHIISVTRKLGQEGSLTETVKGYDALGNQLTLVKKNAELASVALKQDGVFTKDLRYANELYAEQVAHLKSIHELRAQRLYVQDGSPKAAALDGQIEETAKLYQANQELITQLNAQVVAKSKLAELAKEEARYTSRYASEQDKAHSGTQEIRQLQEAYQRLTTAHREYDTAKKAGSYTGMTYWKQSADGTMQEIRAIESKLATLDIEESTRRRLLDLIQQSANAEAAHAKGINPLTQMGDQLGKQMLQMVSITALLHGLSSLWQNALSYGAEYYDLMNEIRIVSGQSQKQADEMGDRFRAMAKDMRVSSTEIAKAAVEFYRQGLPDNEVNARLTSTIHYSKISSMAFDEAAQLITSAVNTMDVSAERVASVWAFLGDASASG